MKQEVHWRRTRWIWISHSTGSFEEEIDEKIAQRKERHVGAMRSEQQQIANWAGHRRLEHRIIAHRPHFQSCPTALNTQINPLNFFRSQHGLKDRCNRDRISHKIVFFRIRLDGNNDSEEKTIFFFHFVVMQQACYNIGVLVYIACKSRVYNLCKQVY